MLRLKNDPAVVSAGPVYVVCVLCVCVVCVLWVCCVCVLCVMQLMQHTPVLCKYEVPGCSSVNAAASLISLRNQLAHRAC